MVMHTSVSVSKAFIRAPKVGANVGPVYKLVIIDTNLSISFFFLMQAFETLPD